MANVVSVALILVLVVCAAALTLIRIERRQAMLREIQRTKWRERFRQGV